MNWPRGSPGFVGWLTRPTQSSRACGFRHINPEARTGIAHDATAEAQPDTTAGSSLDSSAMVSTRLMQVCEYRPIASTDLYPSQQDENPEDDKPEAA
jgi:hypothetical protein